MSFMSDPLSAENPLVRELRELHRPEGRRQAGALLVEGRRAIDGFLAGGARPDLVLIPPDTDAPPHWPAPRTISPRAAARLTQAKTPSGWFARFPLPMPPDLDPARGGLILVHLADPGNVGTLLRSAAAFACPQVVVVGGADPYGHKVVQATAGALPAVAVHTWADHATPERLLGGAPLTALVVSGGQAPDALQPGPRWLVIGSEAHGLPPEWLAACSDHLTLPMAGRTESLNAAVAGSIACYLMGNQ
jgi:RNA methyltransferase, TrmH family